MKEASAQQEPVGRISADYEIPVSEDWKDGMSYADGKLKEKNSG